MWGSGTGGAGIFGALSYLALRDWFGFNSFWSLIIITPLPFLIGISYFLILSGGELEKILKKEEKERATGTEQYRELQEEKLSLPEQYNELRDEQEADDTVPKSKYLKDESKAREEIAAFKKLSFKARIKYLLPLLKYMIPLYLVYCEFSAAVLFQLAISNTYPFVKTPNISSIKELHPR